MIIEEEEEVIFTREIEGDPLNTKQEEKGLPPRSPVMDFLRV